MKLARDLVVVMATAGSVACAAGGRAPNAKSASGAAPSAEQAPASQPVVSTPAQTGAGASSTPPSTFAPPPPPPAAEEKRPAGGTSRTMALSRASTDFDSSQRELDVAAGDCRNACRALGSMDRAAGRLCELAQDSTETTRCEEVKRKVYSARDRVKSTCGTCADGTSVDRSAPIPSVR